MQDQKIKLVVIDNHTLASIRPGSMFAEVLKASTLKGAPFRVHDDPILYAGNNVRLATEQDFVDFRCVFDGYKNDPQYEYSREGRA